MIDKDGLLDFLISSEVPDNAQPETEATIVNKLFKYSWDLTPKALYRYRECNLYAFQALEEDKFLLTKPTLFNDPYDSLLYINRQTLIDWISMPLEFDILKKLKEDVDFRREQITLLGEEFVNKFLNAKEANIHFDNVSLRKATISSYTKLVDAIIDEAIKSLKQSSLVGCLSEEFDSILMWSHYADNHKGFVLNYDFKSRHAIETNIKGLVATEFADKKIFPVRYTSERFDATKYAEFHFIDNYYRQLNLRYHEPFFDKLFYYKILLFKAVCWNYENEWRIIKLTNVDYDDGKPEIDFITHIRPKEILLGDQISPANKSYLEEIGIKKNIPIYQMRLELHSGEYKLTKKGVNSK